MGANQSVQAQPQSNSNTSTTLVVPERKSEKMIKILNSKLVDTVETKNNLFEEIENISLHFSKVIFDSVGEIRLLLLDENNNFQDDNFDSINDKLKVLLLVMKFFTENPNLKENNRNQETNLVKNENEIYEISNALDKLFENKLQKIDKDTKTVFESVRSYHNNDSEEFKKEANPFKVLKIKFDTLKRNGFRFQDALEYLRIANVRLMELCDNYVKYYQGEYTTYSQYNKGKNLMQDAKESFGYYVGEMIFTYGYFSSDRTTGAKAKFYKDFKLNKLKPFERKIERFNEDKKQCYNIVKETLRKFKYWDCPILANTNDSICFYFDSNLNSNNNDDDDEDFLFDLDTLEESKTLLIKLGNCNMLSYLNFEQQIKEEMSKREYNVSQNFVDDQRTSVTNNNGKHKFKIDYIYEDIEDSTNDTTPTAVGPSRPPSEKSILRNNYNIPNERRFLFRSKKPFKLVSNRSTAREYFGFLPGRGNLQSSTKTFQNGEVVHYLVSQFPLDLNRRDKANQRIRHIAQNLETISQKMNFTKYQEINKAQIAN